MNFDKNFMELIKNKGIKKFRVMNRSIPYGYHSDGETLKTKKREVLQLELDTENMSWLEDLNDKYVIQIGDTFYRKGGNCFLYDYYNPSNDYLTNLAELAEYRIYIFIDGDLPDQSC